MKVIITGSTGMIGKGVLLECLDDNRITEVLAINRRSLNIKHAKLKELKQNDFTKFSSVSADFGAYDGCFHCMGISVLGKSEADYTRLTFDVTKSLADACFSANPQMVFNYVSGTGTDSSEKGNSMWARVKGRTENYVLGLGFKDSYMFRPGMIIPERGIKSSTKWYNIMYVITKPLFPWFRKMKNVTSTTRIGLAMINSINASQELKLLEGRDINAIAASK
ncbi:MAG: NAD-dependent epimerase/dehydratase family protein [Bacteroidia bacterium]|nr:NAD-dependent epimerase/dehydratase family protein [Bacteroidia bacterium]NNJ54939.1 NAD-dependent epimerase/dehydratase family protein [Bacteroidia bacterium]